MSKLFKIFLILLISIINSCAGKDEEKIVLENKDLELQMIEAYNAGIIALDEGDVLFAAKNFNAVENLYPQSIWAPKSILMAAYSFYSQDYYGDAISELKRFIKKYPANENIPYAYFLLATCYYELILDQKKDLSPLLKSKENYLIIINKYPDTDFAIDAKFKLLLIDNILASKELYVGKYYQEKEKWIPALNRFKTVVENYSETEYVEESIHRLVEVYYKLGIDTEAQKYASLLGYNYQSSRWYEESYRIFNKEYSSSFENIKKDKQNFIIRKFKSLF